MALPLDSVVAAVRNVLDVKGVLPRLRAELRLAVHTALSEKEKEHGIHRENPRIQELRNKEDPSLQICIGVIADFLSAFKLSTTLTAFMTEMGMSEHDVVDRQDVISKLHIPRLPTSTACLQSMVTQLQQPSLAPASMQSEAPAAHARHSSPPRSVPAADTFVNNGATFLTSMVSPASTASQPQPSPASTPSTPNRRERDDALTASPGKLSSLAGTGGAFATVSPSPPRSAASTSSPHRSPVELSPTRVATSAHEHITPHDAVNSTSQTLDTSKSDSFASSTLAPHSSIMHNPADTSPLADSAAGGFAFHPQTLQRPDDAYGVSEENVETRNTGFSKSITKSLGLGADLARLAREMAAAADGDDEDNRQYQQLAEEEEYVATDASVPELVAAHAPPVPTVLGRQPVTRSIDSDAAEDENDNDDEEEDHDDVVASRRAIKDAAKTVIASPLLPNRTHRTEESASYADEEYEDDFDAEASASAMSLHVPTSFAAAAAVNNTSVTNASALTNFSISQSKDVDADVVEEDILATSDLSEASSPHRKPSGRVFQLNMAVGEDASTATTSAAASKTSAPTQQQQQRRDDDDDEDNEDWF